MILQLLFAGACIALGTTLVVLRDRLGAQARAQGHRLTTPMYLLVGAILVAAGAYAAADALV
ncbi:MAG: hypothetical protein H0T13_09300 [Actinobacteria bacterium]|nr:hypothetical protein [Actinomycetota bacterium]